MSELKIAIDNTEKLPDNSSIKHSTSRWPCRVLQRISLSAVLCLAPKWTPQFLLNTG